MFQKAVKHEAKLRLAISGPSGAGKTYTALAVGSELGRVAVVDTEHGSASKYADLFEFDVLNMDPPFHPERFVEAIRAAEAAGYDVVILDSISHAWFGSGGVLDIVDQAAKRSKSGNTYVAWKEGTPAHNALIEGIVGARLHVIATMRSKTEYALVANDRGKVEPKKIGMAPVQRDGMEYEFDVLIDMDIENNGIVSKTRCPALTGQVIARPGADLAATLRDWLSGAPQLDPVTEMMEAATADAWARAAYRQTAVRTAFENPTRLLDWRHYVTGNGYDAGDNGPLAQVLADYCGAVADGAKVRDAAERARRQYLDEVQPLFDDDEEE